MTTRGTASSELSLAELHFLIEFWRDALREQAQGARIEVLTRYVERIAELEDLHHDLEIEIVAEEDEERDDHDQ